MQTEESTAGPPTLTSRLPLREISIFVLLAFGLAWLVYLPAVVGGATPEDPIYGISATLYMFTPGIAALLVTFFVWRPRSVLRATGLIPLRPVRRVGGYSLAALLMFIGVGMVAPLVAGVFGVIRFDFEEFSGFHAGLEAQAPALVPYLPDSGAPVVALLVAFGFVAVTIFPMVLLSCLGEEVGWRGYLFPRLLPLGVWPALLVSGVIHGLWHSPQLLLQMQAGTMDVVNVVMFLVFCVVVGVVLGWLRLASGSVWPAVIGHAANNSFAVLGFLFVSHVDTPTHPVLYGGNTGGVIGMALLLAVVLPFALRGGMRVRSFDPVLHQAS